MAVKRYVLVGVGGFAVDIKMESAVEIMDDSDVEHCYPSILLDLFCPFERDYASTTTVQLPLKRYKSKKKTKSD